MEICFDVVKFSNMYERNEFDNPNLKKEYIMKNFEIINNIMKNTIGYCGSFGTGYPFYALDENFNGNLPVIQEQLRYNMELEGFISNSSLTEWPCEKCLKINGTFMEDLKKICIPCPNLANELKPRKIINRLPDIDMWMVCEDAHIENAKCELSIKFNDFDMHTSDVDPVQTIKDFKEIVLNLKNNQMPIKMLPLDIHIVKYSELERLLTQVPFTILIAKENGEIPYLPILPDSLRKKWQKDNEAYNFVMDFLYSMRDFNFESILKQKIDYARKIIASNLTEEELFDLLNLVFLDSARRRFENDDLKSIYKRRIKSWKR